MGTGRGARADKTPELVHSVDPLLAQVLTNVWPEEAIRQSREAYEPRDMEGGPTPNPYGLTLSRIMRPLERLKAKRHLGAG